MHTCSCNPNPLSTNKEGSTHTSYVPLECYILAGWYHWISLEVPLAKCARPRKVQPKCLYSSCGSRENVLTLCHCSQEFKWQNCYCNLIGPHSVVQWDMVHQTLILSVIVEEDLACKSNVHLTLILIHNNIFCAICTFVGEKIVWYRSGA